LVLGVFGFGVLGVRGLISMHSGIKYRYRVGSEPREQMKTLFN